MRVAVLADIHGNLPALDAVLAEVERERPDAIVVAGDVLPGPLPRETLDRLATLSPRPRFVMGNGDREVLEAFDGAPEAPETDRWAAARLDREHRDALAAYEATVTLEVDGLGPVVFCHGTPRSDTEMITILTPPERAAPMLDGVRERVIVGGHTHRQFDRELAGHRVVNAGSVGLPYEGAAAAFWALLGPDVELRRTEYDVDAALRELNATRMPMGAELLRDSLAEPTDPDEVARYFERRAGD